MNTQSLCLPPRGVAIRRAVPADCAELDRLALTAFRHAAPAHYTAGQTTRILRFLIKIDRGLITTGRLFVLQDDGRLIGCAGWSSGGPLIRGAADEVGSLAGTGRNGDGPGPDDRPGAEIRCVYVHPDRHRRGVAKRLLVTAERDAVAAGHRRFSLIATLPSVPFYLSRGYHAVQAIEIPMPEGAPVQGLAMTKDVATRCAR